MLSGMLLIDFFYRLICRMLFFHIHHVSTRMESPYEEKELCLFHDDVTRAMLCPSVPPRLGLYY